MIDRMRRALQEYEIGGIRTTLPFFREVMEDEEFVAGRLHTGFIPEFNERRVPAAGEPQLQDMAAVVAALQYEDAQRKPKRGSGQATPPSRWRMSARPAHSLDSWK